MTSKELRQRTDAALAGLEGDTSPVRALCFELGRRLRDAGGELAESTRSQAALRSQLAAQADRLQVLEDQLAAARERITRLEGEFTALWEYVPPLAVIGVVEIKATGQTCRLNPDPAADELVRQRWAGKPARVYVLNYVADSWEEVRGLQRMWDALGLSRQFSPERPESPPPA
jgi:hypothetical protein